MYFKLLFFTFSDWVKNLNAGLLEYSSKYLERGKNLYISSENLNMRNISDQNQRYVPTNVKCATASLSDTH